MTRTPSRVPKHRRSSAPCVCFGLGRYLYYHAGTWVDLDEGKRPKTAPALPVWATPEGWSQGLRPQQTGNSPKTCSSSGRQIHQPIMARRYRVQ